MALISQNETKALIDEIVDLSVKLDRYYEKDPILPVVESPANKEELAMLEKHWGCFLPPFYRQVLTAYNGISKIWSDVPLLSTHEIIEDQVDITTFEEPFPDLWKYIFVCGAESYDALCFDGSKREENNDMPVIELSDDGIGRKWANFYVFLTYRLDMLKKELIQEEIDRGQFK